MNQKQQQLEPYDIQFHNSTLPPSSIPNYLYSNILLLATLDFALYAERGHGLCRHDNQERKCAGGRVKSVLHGHVDDAARHTSTVPLKRPQIAVNSEIH